MSKCPDIPSSRDALEGTDLTSTQTFSSHLKGCLHILNVVFSYSGLGHLVVALDTKQPVSLNYVLL